MEIASESEKWEKEGEKRLDQAVFN